MKKKELIEELQNVITDEIMANKNKMILNDLHGLSNVVALRLSESFLISPLISNNGKKKNTEKKSKENKSWLISLQSRLKGCLKDVMSIKSSVVKIKWNTFLDWLLMIYRERSNLFNRSKN